MKTYVIHVSDAYARKAHIQNELDGKDLDITYITKGDKKDLTAEVLDEYFSEEMAAIKASTSCAYKHILAYQTIVAEKDHLVLILEDDIKFYKHFSILQKIVTELEIRKIENFMLSLEDSNLRYIPKSEREIGTLIYPKKTGRMAGAYLIDKKGAKSILQHIKKEKINIPIDWYHNLCVKNYAIKMYWSHPAIAFQSSLDGSMKSLIVNKNKYGIFAPVLFKIKKLYKHFLYQLR